jgi:hypothetical protein
VAKLVLAHHGEVTLEDLYAALRKRLSSRYDVHVTETQGTPNVKVSKTAWMAIEVDVSHRQNQTTLRTSYTPGSELLMMLLMVLVVTWPLLLFLRRSRSRRELEAEVVEAIRDSWRGVRG